MDIAWSIQRLYQWEFWVAKGYNAHDLHTVIAHIKKRIFQKRRYPESLAFRNLIGNTDRFAEDLAEARAENRGRVDPGKAAVLRATGRPVREHSHAQPAKEVVERLLADLRKAAE